MVQRLRILSNSWILVIVLIEAKQNAISHDMHNKIAVRGMADVLFHWSYFIGFIGQTSYMNILIMQVTHAHDMMPLLHLPSIFISILLFTPVRCSFLFK